MVITVQGIRSPTGVVLNATGSSTHLLIGKLHWAAFLPLLLQWIGYGLVVSMCWSQLRKSCVRAVSSEPTDLTQAYPVDPHVRLG